MDESRHGVDDAALLAASAAGERDAFAMFYRRHLAGVLAVLVKATGDRELAADLAAEVFAAALIAAGRYRAERETALPWLSAIARHKARDSVRAGELGRVRLEAVASSAAEAPGLPPPRRLLLIQKTGHSRRPASPPRPCDAAALVDPVPDHQPGGRVWAVLLRCVSGR